MAAFAHLKRVALTLPLVVEVDHFGGPSFTAKGKTFALWAAQSKRTILKLPQERQLILFDMWPETFAPCRVATVNWSYVELKNLNVKEVEAYTVEAWATVAPKRVSKAFLKERGGMGESG
jgi:hypothetical protein